jgi:hypothetical protein
MGIKYHLGCRYCIRETPLYYQTDGPSHSRQIMLCRPPSQTLYSSRTSLKLLNFSHTKSQIRVVLFFCRGYMRRLHVIPLLLLVSVGTVIAVFTSRLLSVVNLKHIKMPAEGEKICLGWEAACKWLGH